jgi:hypothetical protein
VDSANRSPTGLAFEQLRDDVGATLVHANVVDVEDVGVVEGARGLDLPLEAAQPIRVCGDLLGQDLDRDLAIETGVTCPIDLPHASRSQRSEDFVRTETCS